MLKRLFKVIILCVMIAYIPLVCFVPQLSFLKEDIMAWIIYVICVLVVIFVLSMFKEHKPPEKSGDDDSGTQEILRERSKWYNM